MIVARAQSRFVRCSPFKLRELLFGIRGKRLDSALGYLVTHKSRRTVILEKLLLSAWANAKVKNESIKSKSELIVSIIKVDQGPVFKYFIPSARERVSVQRRRLSHVEVELKSLNKKEEVHSGSQS